MTSPHKRPGPIRSKSPARKPTPDPLGGRELDARRAERLQTVQILKTGRTPLQLVEAAERAVALAEKEIGAARAIAPPPKLACQEGCAWCCYLRVGTAVPEVLRIVTYLRETLSAEELHAVRERVLRLDEERRQQRAAKRGDLRLPCALLKEQRCLAYPVRPLTCRGFNSRDANQCERFVRLGPKVSVPTYTPQLRLTTFIFDGLRAGITEAGLKGDLLELTAALRIALEQPDAFDRWLAGQPVFAPARLE